MTDKMHTKRKSLFERTGVFVILFLFLSLSLKIQAIGSIAENTAGNDSESRADIVKFNGMEEYGVLDRSPVLFSHEIHTDALEKVNKDCKECHKVKDDKVTFLFKRLKADKYTTEQLIEGFHVECITCHAKRIGPERKLGPVTCAECHIKTPAMVSVRQPVGMDKSLHHRHSDTLEKEKASKDIVSCDQCHHEYDKEAKKLIHPPNKEGTCRYCHKEVEQEETSSMEFASHASCVNCHLKRKEAKKEKNGPVKCSGCHDLAEQQKIKKAETIARIERKQPDMIMIKTGDKKIDQPEKPENLTRLNFVPFNHKDHEATPYTCKDCHHAEISSCNKCHTIRGSKDGANIPLEQAMHDPFSQYSCIGCHRIATEDKKCVGCHAPRSATVKQNGTDAACLMCHMEQPDGIEADVVATLAGSVFKDSTEYEKAKDAKTAEILISMRKQDTSTYEKEDIPEKLELKLELKLETEGIDSKYKPAPLPHRKIVDSIVKDLKDNKLAGYFHTDKGTMCNGCHHNSPVTKKPSKCASCHAITCDNNIDKPGIVGAYHRQCIGCHDVMKVEKSVNEGKSPGRLDWSCTDCHEKKKEIVI